MLARDILPLGLPYLMTLPDVPQFNSDSSLLMLLYNAILQL